MSFLNDVTVEEVEALWGKEFSDQCVEEAFEVRKKIHEEKGLDFSYSRIDELPVTLILVVAIKKCMKEEK